MSFEDSNFEDTKLGTKWAKHVKGQPRNDFLIVVTAGSKTPVSGTGKTTLGLRLAKQTDLAGGFEAEEQATLDAGDIAYRMLPDLDSGSAILWDEAQGTPGKEGLDARRSMKETSIQAINSVLANRDKHFTIVIVAQQFSMLDSRLYPLIDAWCLIKTAPSAPDGPSGVAYNVYVEEYDLKSPDIRTPAIEDFSWGRVPHDDEDYRTLEAMKQDAKTADNGSDGSANGDESVSTPLSIDQRNDVIKMMYKNGVSQVEIADELGMKQPRVSQIVNEE